MNGGAFAGKSIDRRGKGAKGTRLEPQLDGSREGASEEERRHEGTQAKPAGGLKATTDHILFSY